MLTGESGLMQFFSASRTIAVCVVLAILALGGPAYAAPQPWEETAARSNDVDALYAFMKATHPDLYHRTPQSEFDSYVAGLRRDAPQMDWPHYVMGVYGMVRLAGDGHTAIFPFPDGPGFDSRLPILTEAFADGLYVVAADAPYREIVGAKVVAVAGKPVAEIVAAMTQYWPHENDQWVVRWLPAMLRRPGYLLGTGIADGTTSSPITFTVQLGDGSRRNVALTALPEAEDTARQKSLWVHARDETKLPRPTPLHGTAEPFGYYYMKDRKALYAVYRQCDDAPTETVAAFSERLFKFAESTPVDRLIIDVRENGGGNNYKNQALLLRMIKSRQLDRLGHLFILTGRQTFSAAQNFVNHAERWTQALFVGEPTGSAPNHFGDAKPFTLPATKLSILVASLRWQDSDPQDKRIWIMPDVVARGTFADYLTGRDVALDAALAYQAPKSAKETDPFEHWYRPGQWIKDGENHKPVKEFKFDW